MKLKKHKFISLFFGVLLVPLRGIPSVWVCCTLLVLWLSLQCATAALPFSLLWGRIWFWKMTQCELWTRRASVTSPSIYKIHKALGQTCENDYFSFNQTARRVLTHWVSCSPSAIGPYLWLQWTFSSSWIRAHGFQQKTDKLHSWLWFKNVILHSIREKSHVHSSSSRVSIYKLFYFGGILRWQQTVLTWKVVLKDKMFIAEASYSNAAFHLHRKVEISSFLLGKLQ